MSAAAAALKAAQNLVLQNQAGKIRPVLPGNQITLQTNAPAATNWNPTQSTASCAALIGGHAVFWLGVNGNNFFYRYTADPAATVTVAAPVPANVVWGGRNGLADTVTNEAVVTCLTDPNLAATDEHGGLANGAPAQATAAASDPHKANAQTATGTGMLRGPQVIANDQWAEDDQNWTFLW